MLGPFKELPHPPVGLHAWHYAKKALGDYCLIHHLSYPKLVPVNNGKLECLYSIQYTSFDQVVRIVRHCGRGAESVKCNISQSTLMTLISWGFPFDGCFYMDRVLP